MSTEKSGRSGKVAFFSAMLGSLVGVAVGLLVAPEEGRKVRRRVVYQVDRAYKKVRALLELPTDLEREARQTGRSLVKGAEEQASEILHDVDALINEVKRGTS